MHCKQNAKLALDIMLVFRVFRDFRVCIMTCWTDSLEQGRSDIDGKLTYNVVEPEVCIYLFPIL